MIADRDAIREDLERPGQRVEPLQHLLGLRLRRSPAWAEALAARPALVGILLLALMISLHLAIQGLVPSGGDAGNWLALGRERFGDPVMSADVSYAPVFPWLVGLLLQVTGPLAAIVIGGLVAKSVLVLAVYWCGRPAGRPAALAAAAIVALAGFQLEAYAWGGYPQLLATGMALVAVHLAVRFAALPSWPSLLALLTLVVLVFATHKLLAGLLLVAVPVGLGYWYGLDRPRPLWWPRLLLPVGATAVAALPFLVQWVIEGSRGVHPVINPLEQRIGELVSLTVREAPVIWLLVAGMALAGLMSRVWREGSAWAASAAVGFLVSGLAFFLLSGEQRALLVVQVGAAILAAMAATRAIGQLRERGPRWERAGLGLAAVALLWVSLAGLGRYASATDWYRVMGRTELNALAELRRVSQPGDLVVAARGHHGNPLGWWVEGYAGRPTFTGLDLRFLAFPEEARQAALANSFFSGALAPQQAAAHLEVNQIRFIIVDRRGPDAGWLSSAARESLDPEPVIDSGWLVVLRVRET
jgi:hypothetical protein